MRNNGLAPRFLLCLAGVPVGGIAFLWAVYDSRGYLIYSDIAAVAIASVISGSVLIVGARYYSRGPADSESNHNNDE